MFDLNDFYLKRKQVMLMGHFSTTFMRELEVKYGIAHTERGISVSEVFVALGEEIKDLKKKLNIYYTAIGGKKQTFSPERISEENEEDLKINLAMKKEELLSKKITNQAKLMSLIPKNEATKRVKKALSGVASTIEYTIRTVAPQLVSKTDLRDIEIIITTEWNKAVKILEESSTIEEWETDGASKLLRTRLENLDEEELQFLFGEDGSLEQSQEIQDEEV